MDLKKLLSLPLALCMVSSLMPVTVLAEEGEEAPQENSIISEEPAETERDLTEEEEVSITEEAEEADAASENTEETEQEISAEETAQEDSYAADDEITTWVQLQEAFNAGGNVVLNGDITASSGDSALTVPFGVTVSLDLNGADIDGAGQTSNGYVVRVDGRMNLYDSSEDQSGRITGGTDSGVCIGDRGELTMEGGSIAGNRTGDSGGGVFMNSGGIFNMHGGSIAGNDAGDYGYGGGVFVNSRCVFRMHDGSITGNHAGQGGGVCAYFSGTFHQTGGTIDNNSVEAHGGGVQLFYDSNFNMEGGSITDNTAGNSGGGVYVGEDCTFEMRDGSIAGNTSAESGGGVGIESSGTYILNGGTISGNNSGRGGGVYAYMDTIFEMNGGSVTDNTADKGGGVYAYGKDAFTMNDGTISDNYAAQGGGIYTVYSGKFTMNGGSVTGNTAELYGGAYLAEYATLDISGGPVIADNYAGGVLCNTYMDRKSFIAIVSPLSEEASVGIKMSGPGTFTGGYSEKMGSADPAEYFTSDDAEYSVKTIDGEAGLTERQSFAVNYDANGGTGTAETDIVFEDEEFFLPECTFEAPAGGEFAGWLGEDGRIYAEGAPAEITGDCTFAAQWKEAFNIKVCGTKVTFANKDDILSDGGSAKYDPAENTLTVNGLFGPDDDATDFIYSEDTDLIIEGSATAVLFGEGTGIFLPRNTVTLRGDFTITGMMYSIYAKNVIIESGSLKAVSVNSDAVHAYRGDIRIEAGIAKVDAAGSSHGLQSVGGRVYVNEELAVTEPADGDLSAPHVVITAVYNYDVSYDGNGGTGTMENEIVTSLDQYVLPDCAFEAPPGTKFAGWLGDDGTVYAEGDPAEITGDCTFKALWEQTFILSVGGVNVTTDNMGDIFGDGKAVFDPRTNTLTLTDTDGFPGHDNGYLISTSSMDLRIEGSGKISFDDELQQVLYAVSVNEGTLTLAGDFEITSGRFAIHTNKGNIVFESGTCIITSGGRYEAVYAARGAVEIGPAMKRLEINSQSTALTGENGITIDSSLVMEKPAGGAVNINGVLIDAYDNAAAEVVITAKPEPEFSGHQLILTGSLGLRFGMKFPEGFDSTGSYMTFMVSGEEQTVNTADAAEEDGLTIYTCTLNTLQMAEEIEAVFHYGDQEITQIYSLADYFTYFDENPSQFDPQILSLVKAVADYGYYAQPYLVSANSLEGKYAPVTKHYTESYDYEAVKEAVSGYTFAKAISDSAVEKASYKLSLDSDTALTVLMQVPAGTELTASAVFGGKTYTAEKLSDTVYAVKVTGIKASQLGNTITVNGSAEGDFTITVSALSYVRTVLNSSKYSDEAKNTVCALYKYHEAVNGYNH